MAARDLIAPEINRADFIFGGNIAALQFLRLAFPRQFLPQANYWPEDPALLYLLAHFDDGG